MLFKFLTVILALMLVAESAEILMHRHSPNRFKPVEEFGYGLVAFDTATGQVCKTLRTGPSVGGRSATPSSNPSPKEPSGDPFFDEIDKAAQGRADDDATQDFVRKLPACADIR
jgi:hypothetical protein